LFNTASRAADAFDPAWKERRSLDPGPANAVMIAPITSKAPPIAAAAAAAAAAEVAFVELVALVKFVTALRIVLERESTALTFPRPASRDTRADSTLAANEAFEADTRASSAAAAALEATATLVVTSTILRDVLDDCKRRRRSAAGAGCRKRTSPVSTFTASVTFTSASLTLAVRATAAAMLRSVAGVLNASARAFLKSVLIDTLARTAPTAGPR